MTETNIRLAPQVDFIATVMMGGHAGRPCFNGAHSCTRADAPWLPLHGQCVLVKLHPIWNLDGLEFRWFPAENKPSYVEVESSRSQIRLPRQRTIA